MDKLKMQTPDLTDKNIEQIAALFPNVITETKDENGNLKKTVDFDLLRQTLSKNIVEADDERYRLDWPGKKASLLKANTPITKTLRPCREESVNFDTTENLYIEGDNFEVLKILQESYLGKVKMMYIDPPYNTGNDFIYKDDFKKSNEEYEEELGVEDEDGGKLFRNTDSNGRFHSDWLSMMYEPLVVARDLLRDDGVIFLNIGEEEISNSEKILDEIFGSVNKISIVSRVAKTASNLGTHFASSVDFVVVYAKNVQFLPAFKDSVDESLYKKIETFGDRIGEKYRDNVAFYQSSQKDLRPNQKYFIECPDGSKAIPPCSIQDEIMREGDGRWRWAKETYLKKKHLIVFKETKNSPLLNEHGNKSKYNLYTKSYLKDREAVGTLPRNLITDFINRQGADLIKKMGIKFDFSKPVGLIKYLCQIQDYSENNIVLDFFSGSATTAHAVMQQNAEDGGNRKFIMVQLPEKTDEKSEAYKAGYKTIAEIGKERIRRAGKKILSELESKSQQLKLGEEPVDASKLDIGFRVYKTDSTNMKDVFYHPSELKQMTLDDLLSNIKEDRTPEDLLTQVILDLGLELTLPIETKKILGNTVFIVQTNALVACFDNNIDFKIVDTIADLKPFKVVFKDASFKDDKDRINVEERFKRLSPETKVTVI
ncbi:MAG: site-specific DNA-methyltransferase [Proteobacteria bacterium]|nr:site-specific DNA-methyltransferase [Pseudomonadota bacterium]